MEQFVQIDKVSKYFLNKKKCERVLHDISFNVKKGEFVSILGQSGCGKSTLLNIIGGFQKVDKGRVMFNGQVVTRPSRKCVMLFQHYGLLPWRTVLKNVELGLEQVNMTSKERKECAFKYLTLVGLDHNADQFPHQLSGGMQQRVAIARALAIKPELILMDEPFAALDTFNRYYLQDELLRLQSKEKTTVILVTHDIDEAVYLSDRIMIMNANPGRIHKQLTIETSRPRDRSHSDFQYYRKMIFEQFHLNSRKTAIEYEI